MKPSNPIAHQPYLDVQAYVTKDRSTIRELMCPARHGNQAQSLAEAIVPAGRRTLLHRHLSSEEIYFIVRGEGLMTLGDTSFPVRAGDTICIPPGTPHAITAGPRQRLRILCACSPAYSHDDTELLEPEPVVVPRAPRPPRVRAGRPPTAKHVGAPIALDMQSGANFKAVRDSLGLGQAAFWKRVFVTQSGGSRYESGRNIPASIRALIILVFGTEHHARQQLEALRDPGVDKPSKPRAPMAAAAPSSA